MLAKQQTVEAQKSGLEEGDYLSNRFSLFRFEGFLPNAEGVVLEDCFTNTVSTYDLLTFAEMKLSQVRKTRADRD